MQTFGMGAPDGKPISINSAGAKILCAKHNSDLSDLDVEIAKLTAAIGEYWRLGGDSSHTVNGRLVERWMLKYIVEVSAAGYPSSGVAHAGDAIVRQIFGLEPVFDQFALHGVVIGSVPRVWNTSVSLEISGPIGEESDIALFSINSLPLLSYVGDCDVGAVFRSIGRIQGMDVSEAAVIRRPKTMVLTSHNARLNLNFEY